MGCIRAARLAEARRLRQWFWSIQAASSPDRAFKILSEHPSLEFAELYSGWSSWCRVRLHDGTYLVGGGAGWKDKAVCECSRYLYAELRKRFLVKDGES